MGTTRGTNKSFLSLFKGNQKRTRHPSRQGIILVNPPYLQAIWFQGTNQFKRKDIAVWGFWLRRQIQSCHHTISTSWLANINTIAFQNKRQSLGARNTFLGSANPCPNAVHMEPLSTSVFKVLIWIFATTTKICTRVRCTQIHTTSFETNPSPSYSSLVNLQWWHSISHTLKRHPFSGLVHSAGELLHTP